MKQISKGLNQHKNNKHSLKHAVNLEEYSVFLNWRATVND